MIPSQANALSPSLRRFSAIESSNGGHSADSETLSVFLPDGKAKTSHPEIQTHDKLRNMSSGQLSFARSGFSAMNTRSIQICAAWTAGSLVVISLIFVFTFFIKPSTLGAAPHAFVYTDLLPTNGQPTDAEQKWLDDFSHLTKPRACHSHNDYLQAWPLFSALAAGCSSVEADVWLTDDGTDLLVGHDKASLTPDRTLANMYLDPLLRILDSINAAPEGVAGPERTRPRGVFRTEPDTTLVLLIDVKSHSSDTWPLVVGQLSALRGKQYLARYEGGGLKAGPITVVGSGNIGSSPSVFTSTNVDPNRPFGDYHDTFLDAPLASLPQIPDLVDHRKALSTSPDEPEEMWTNKTAYYASASFKTTIGSVITGFSPSQLSTLRAQIATADRLSLKSRYWGTPDWPVGYRDYVWGVLEREGVGVLNVDDLEGAARGGWDVAGQAWARDAAWLIAVGFWALCCGAAVVVLAWRRGPGAGAKQIEQSS